MSVKQRITDYLKAKNITKSAFGATIGVSASYINSMRKSIQPDKLLSIAQNYKDLNIDWLLTGEGNMLKGQDYKPQKEDLTTSEDHLSIIDRLDKYIELKGINDNQITINAGLSVGLLGKARQGKSDIGKKAIEKILNFYQDIDRVWLLTGVGNILTEPTKMKDASINDNMLSVDHERRMLIESVNRMTGTADRNSRTLEKIIDLLCQNGISVSDLSDSDKRGRLSGNDTDNGTASIAGSANAD